MLRVCVGRLLTFRTLSRAKLCEPLVVTVRNRADAVVSKASGHGLPSVLLPSLTETDESFEAKWIEFFNSPNLDEFELKQGFNDLIYQYDAVPEPEVVSAALKAAKRLNNFAVAIRIIEAVKYKGGGDMNIYNYVIENIRPTLDELGINTLEELGFDKVPSGIMTTEQNRTLNYDVFICSRERCYKYGELYLEQPTMEGQEHKLLTEVPKQLCTLAQIVARMFYQPEHAAIIDVLVHHRCIKEEELLELLLLDGKQLRQSLFYLKKDKVVRSVQKPETTEDGKIYRFSYYYINYKFFVNMVKYKLDHMRKKIENEEKQMRNRTSYVCKNCDSSYADLEVNQLLDSAGVLRCTHCSSELEEMLDTRNSSELITMTRFNTLIKPINSLLRQTENINLAPEILEPSPQNVSVLHLKKGYSQTGRTKSLSESWTTNTGIDLYGEQSGVKVEIGDDQLTERKTAMKECPEWMQFSTITSAEHLPSVQQTSSETWSAAQSTTDVQRDEKIKAELLAYEKSKPTFNQPPQDESSNSDEDNEDDSVRTAANQQVDDDNSSESESESDADHFTMTLDGKVYALNDITEELIAKMTEEEKQTYTSLCREAYDDLF